MRSDSAVASLGSNLVIAKNNKGQVYWPQYLINTIGNMTMGQGYQMYLSSGSTLTYPGNTFGSPPTVLTKKATIAQTLQEELVPKHYTPTQTETGSNAILLVENKDMENGDEIGVWGANNLLIGSGVVSKGNAIITLWGDNTLTADRKEGAAEGENLSLTVWDHAGNKESAVRIAGVQNALSGRTESNQLIYKTDGVWIAQIEGVKQVPTVYSLEQNYPNPFNPSTTIRYGLPKGGKVTLEVYNILGQKVVTLVNGEQKAGSYEVVFDAHALSSGVYIYVLRQEQYTATKKLMLLK